MNMDRNTALWNEADPRAPAPDDRRALDRGRVANPPAAAGDARDRCERRARHGGHARGAGHAELEARAATSYEQWVGSAGLSFRRRDDVYRLHEVVKFHWEAVSPDGEVTAAVGLVFLVLGTDGRIRRDYVFIES